MDPSKFGGFQNDQMQQELALQQQVAQLESMVKQNMTKDAIQRYGNIKAVNPEKAISILAILSRAIQSNQVSEINDDMLKHFLNALTPQKKEFNFRRK